MTALREQYGWSSFRNAEVDYELVRDVKKSVEIRFTIQKKLRSVIQPVKIEGEDKVSKKFTKKQIEFAEKETEDSKWATHI